MTHPSRHPAKRGARTVLATVLACVCLASGSATAQDRPADGDTAVLLFLATRATLLMPAPVRTVRAEAEAALVAAMTGAGRPVADRELVEALQIRHRIRGGNVIDPGFLAALRDEAGAGRLLVVQILVDIHAVQPSGRLIDVATGRLLDAGTVDPVSWSDDGWTTAVAGAAAKLVARLDGPAGRTGDRSLVVLPVQASGIEGGDVVTATHTLLETVLADGGIAVIDPGVVSHRLIEAGLDPRHLDSRGMAVLADSLGTDRMLTAELLSYDTQRRITAPSAWDDAGTIRSVLPSFLYIARLTDLRSGLIAGSTSFYHDDKPRTGWFGTSKTKTSRRVLGEAAQRLWAGLATFSEDSHD